MSFQNENIEILETKMKEESEEITKNVEKV